MESSDNDKRDVIPAENMLKKQDREFAYLCVDEFIEDIFQARALATAFETGLIDTLIQKKSLSYASLMEHEGRNSRGMRLLIGLLVQNRVLDHCDGAIALTEEFVYALEFRDLLELKIYLANLAAHDFLDHFSDLVYRPDQFFHKVKFFRLFSYDRCFSHSRENYEATKRWMRITTTLTKYEAQACMKYYNFDHHQNIMDIGGNSGEFVLQICRKYHSIRAVAFDLPLVCGIGREHIHREPEADRISFIEGNALTDTLPGGFDLITFKSMLHDWPETEAVHFITNASKALVPGGTLLIFERGPMEIDSGNLSFSIIPMFLFYHSFRLPEIYERHLQKIGFQEIAVKWINLESPFFLVTARKKM